MRTEEGNKLIAEFMGFKRYFPNMTSDSELSLHYKYPNVDNVFDETLFIGEFVCTRTNGIKVYKCSIFDITNSRHVKDYRFNSSWNWLMPVIDKIKSTTEEPEELDNLKDTLWFGSIEDVYWKVVDFIKEHNNDNRRTIDTKI